MGWTLGGSWLDLRQKQRFSFLENVLKFSTAHPTPLPVETIGKRERERDGETPKLKMFSIIPLVQSTENMFQENNITFRRVVFFHNFALSDPLEIRFIYLSGKNIYSTFRHSAQSRIYFSQNSNPITGCTDTEVSRRLRLPDFKTIET
jgi:hypothetical protein